MTKEELEQYRSIVAELDEIRDRLNNNTVSDTVTGSDSEFPYVKHAFSVGGVTEHRDNQRDMILKRRLEMQKQEVDDFIEKVKVNDFEMYRILRLKYIKGTKKLKWLKVVKIMYPDWNIQAQYAERDRVKKKVSRFFKNL